MNRNNRKEKEGKNDEFLKSYILHLEKRIQYLENERKSLKSDCIKLEHDVHTLRNELNNLKETPMITGTLVDILDEKMERVIVNTSVGSHFIVNTSKDVRGKKRFCRQGPPDIFSRC